MKNWMPKDIVAWHKQTFPKTTPEEQLVKLANEASEYFNAPDAVNRMEEMADVYITATVLWRRYGEPLGLLIENWRPLGVDDKDIRDAINAKMEVNKQRKWKGNSHIREAQ